MNLFDGMNRTLAEVRGSAGAGIGGVMLTVQLSPAAGRADELASWLTGGALAELAARPGLAAAHLLVADRDVSGVQTEEKRLRGAPDAVADWVLLVEGYDEAAVEQTAAGLSGDGGLIAHGAAPGSMQGLYRLDYLIDEAVAKAIWRPPEG